MRPPQPHRRRPLRFGVLGCADIARRRTLPALAASPRTEITALASRDAGRAAGFAAEWGGAAVEGYDALLRRDDLDAVYVPLPPAEHARWVGRALDAGLHVLVEKPCGTSRDEVAAMTRRGLDAGLAVVENTMVLRHRQHRAVRRAVDEGRIGTVRAFSGVFGFPMPAPEGFRLDPSRGGGALLDAGIYPVRVAHHLLGPLHVDGAVLRVDAASGVDLAGRALLHTGDGVPVDVGFGFGHGYRGAYELWGSAGRLVLERAYTPPPDLTPQLRLEHEGDAEPVACEPDDQFAGQIDWFADAVADEDVRRRAAEESVAVAGLLDHIRAVATRVTQR